MDVFLAVKVDDSSTNDLAILLHTLQQISSLQSSITATGAAIKVEVDNSNVIDKIDALKKWLEDDVISDLGSGGGSSAAYYAEIKSNTDFIISRLWSVNSPMASKDQMKDRLAHLGTNTDDIIKKFIDNVRDPKVLEGRFGTIKKGKEELSKSIRIIIGDIIKDLDNDVFTAETKQKLEVLERTVGGAKDVGTPTIDKVTSLSTGIEEKYQALLTKLINNKIYSSTDGSLKVVNQLQMGGLTNVDMADSKYSNYIDQVKADPSGDKGYDLSEDLRRRLYKYRVDGGSKTEFDSLYEEVFPSETNWKQTFLKEGNMVPPKMIAKFRKERYEEFKADKDLIFKAFFSKYIERFKLDEMGYFSPNAIKKSLEGNAEFESYLKTQFGSIYTNPKLVDGYTEFIMDLFNKHGNEIRNQGYLVYENEWKKIARSIDRTNTSKAHGLAEYLINLVSRGHGLGMHVDPEASTPAEFQDKIDKYKKDDKITTNKQIYNTLAALSSKMSITKNKDDFEQYQEQIKELLEVVGKMEINVGNLADEVGVKEE